MKFTIITPSFNQLDYLKRCVASVRDQVATGVGHEALGVGGGEPSTINHQPSTGLSVHHHIQDGGSTDGTVDWLRQYDAAVGGQTTEDGSPDARSLVPSAYSFSFSSERDDGMYDAINRAIDNCGLGFAANGLRKKTKNFTLPTSNCPDDHIFAWLNCDEQYLEGTLAKVAAGFRAHPEADLMYGNTLNLDEDGELLSYRKCAPLRAIYIKADHLYVHSASMFFRAGIFQAGNRFDTRWRAVSDIVFTLSLLGQGCGAVRLDEYLSAFTMTGENLSGAAVGRSELVELRRVMPRWVQLFRWPINGLRYIEKFLHGGYHETFPMEYAIYGSSDQVQRRKKRALAGTFRFSWGIKKDA